MRSTPSSRSSSSIPSPYIITLSVCSTFLQTLRHSPRPSLAEIPTKAEVFTSHQGIHSGVEVSRIDPCQDEGPQWNSCVGAPPFLNRLCLRAHHRPWRTHTYAQVLCGYDEFMRSVWQRRDAFIRRRHRRQLPHLHARAPEYLTSRLAWRFYVDRRRW